MTSLFIKIGDIHCPVFRGTKLSRMAVEPRKPRKFSTAKINARMYNTIGTELNELKCLPTCVSTCFTEHAQSGGRLAYKA